MKLRDCQSNDIERIRNAYRRGLKSVLYVLSTGGGKFADTVAFSIFAAFADACAAFAQHMGFGFEAELTQINERIRKQFIERLREPPASG